MRPTAPMYADYFVESGGSYVMTCTRVPKAVRANQELRRSIASSPSGNAGMEAKCELMKYVHG